MRPRDVGRVTEEAEGVLRCDAVAYLDGRPKSNNIDFGWTIDHDCTFDFALKGLDLTSIGRNS